MALEPQPAVARREMVVAQVLIFGPVLVLLSIFLAAWATGSFVLHVVFLAWFGVVAVLATSVVYVRRRRLRAIDARWALRFQQLAMRDELTGLFNRRYFDAELRRAIESALETGEPLSLALIDLNGFKVINDTLGHAAGDAAIRQSAATIAAAAGPAAIVARLGGDEFAALLPGGLPGDARTFRARLARRSKRAPSYSKGATRCTSPRRWAWRRSWTGRTERTSCGKPTAPSTSARRASPTRWFCAPPLSGD